jgi:hypothetical protein
MRKHGGHMDLCGSGCRGLILYVHMSVVVLQCLWCCSSQVLNLSVPIACPTFYGPRPG